MPPKVEKAEKVEKQPEFKSPNRQRELEAAISTITKTYGDGSIMRLGDARAKVGIEFEIGAGGEVIRYHLQQRPGV